MDRESKVPSDGVPSVVAHALWILMHNGEDPKWCGYCGRREQDHITYDRMEKLRCKASGWRAEGRYNFRTMRNMRMKSVCYALPGTYNRSRLIFSFGQPRPLWLGGAPWPGSALLQNADASSAEHCSPLPVTAASSAAGSATRRRGINALCASANTAAHYSSPQTPLSR